MSKKVVGSIVLVFLCIFAISAVSHNWKMNDEPVKVAFGLTNGSLVEESINYQLFETFGPILLVLGVLMFGAMIAGICISKEERNEGGERRSQ